MKYTQEDYLRVAKLFEQLGGDVRCSVISAFALLLYLVRRETLERAAKLVEQFEDTHTDRTLAEMIRGLK